MARLETDSLNFNYRCSPTGLLFHDSDAFIKGVVGPCGSGKTTMVVMDFLYDAMCQAPASNGVRYTRFGAIRNTYGNLKSTTRKMIMEVMPRGTGYVTSSSPPYSGVFRFKLGDGTSAHCEWVLWALEDERSLNNIRSANWTGVFLNEASEIPREVFDMIATRVNRYPTTADLRELAGAGVGLAAGARGWAGVKMDFNPVLPDHWVARLFEHKTLTFDGEEMRLDMFSQPPACFEVVDEATGTSEFRLNPDAENLENLQGGRQYYANQIALRRASGSPTADDDIRALYCMRPVRKVVGRMVWPNFDRARHVAEHPIRPVPGQKVVAGFDSSGNHPAVVFGQFQLGRWAVLDELYGGEMGLQMFIEAALKPFVAQRFPDCEIEIVCDPQNAKEQWNLLTPVAHLREAGYDAVVAPTNNIQQRVDCVSALLNVDYGGLVFSPACRTLIEAVESGYRYSRRRVGGTMEWAYSPRPDKNEASHVCDALQYLGLRVTASPVATDKAAEASRRRVARLNELRGARRGAFGRDARDVLYEKLGGGWR
jgi:hypothetical protein